MKQKIIFSATVLFLFFLVKGTWAETAVPIMAVPEEMEPNEVYSINLDKETIAKGYTVAAFGDDLKLSLVPGILDEATPVEIQKLDEDLPWPWKLDKISRVYQFEFKNKAAYDNHKPFYIQFSYLETDGAYKQVFFYDKNFGTWRPLPTYDFPKENFVRSLIHLPFARIAVFSYPDTLAVGKASWYAHKAGNYAASPDFPKGSRLRVYNLENEKFVDVEINDFGPDRSLHPERAIDLEKNAFAKISPLGAGIIKVRIEPLHVPSLNIDHVLAVGDKGIGSEPLVSSAAAIVIDENSGEIIWSKNSTTTLPLASLTKMVAAKVFLDSNPDLNQIVAYKLQDEEYNYQHVNKWESARLRIDDNETLSVADLFYTSLVGSANNTIESLVRISPLSRDDFIAKMNSQVKEWGTESTHFVEPTGLAPENVSSAQDYAIITKEVLKHPLIVKASTMKEYEFYTVSANKYHRIRNTNRIIANNRYAVNGSKTGFLNEAGYCLMTRVAASSDRNVIVITFGAAGRDQSFSETEKLIQYGVRRAKAISDQYAIASSPSSVSADLN